MTVRYYTHNEKWDFEDVYVPAIDTSVMLPDYDSVFLSTYIVEKVLYNPTKKAIFVQVKKEVI